MLGRRPAADLVATRHAADPNLCVYVFKGICTMRLYVYGYLHSLHICTMYTRIYRLHSKTELQLQQQRQQQQQLLGGLGDLIVGLGVCLEGLNVLLGGLGGQLGARRGPQNQQI